MNRRIIIFPKKVFIFLIKKDSRKNLSKNQQHMIPSADFDSNLQGKQPRTSAYVPSNLNPNSLDLSEVLNLSQYHVSKHAACTQQKRAS